MKTFFSHLLLWTLRIIPLVLVGLVIWLPSLLAAGILSVIGWIALSSLGLVAVVLLVMWTLSEGMRS